MKFNYRPRYSNLFVSRRRLTSIPAVITLSKAVYKKIISLATAMLFRIRRLTNNQRWLLIVLLISLVSFIFGFRFRNFIPVATVNGDPVDRRQFSTRLFQKSGEGILNEFIAEILVHQEAERQSIKVSNKEVNVKIREVEEQLKKQGYSNQASLSKNPKARPELEREIRNQLLVERLFSKNIKVTDAEIEKYFTENNIKKGKGAIYESQKIAIRQILYQQALQNRFLNWLNLQKRDARVRVLVRF